MKKILSTIVPVLLFTSPALALDSSEYLRMLSPDSSNNVVRTRGITGEVVQLSHNSVGQSQQAPKKGEVAMNLHFNLGSSRLTPEARRELSNLATALQNPTLRNYRFAIEGHTCDRGSASSNLSLSRRRAASVADFLLNRAGLQPSQFDVTGYGESSPLVPNESESARQKNRRVVIRNTMETINSQPVQATSYQPPPMVHTSTHSTRVDMQIFRYKNDQNQPLDDGEVLRSGDNFALNFNPGTHRYAYVCQMDSAGAVNLLFPDFSVEKNPVSQKNYQVPGNGKYFTLDETVGTEKLVLLTLDADLADPKEACKKAFGTAVIKQQVVKHRNRGVGGITSQGSQIQKESQAPSPTPQLVAVDLCAGKNRGIAGTADIRGVAGVKTVSASTPQPAIDQSQCQGRALAKFFVHQ